MLVPRITSQEPELWLRGRHCPEIQAAPAFLHLLTAVPAAWVPRDETSIQRAWVVFALTLELDFDYTIGV